MYICLTRDGPNDGSLGAVRLNKVILAEVKEGVFNNKHCFYFHFIGYLSPAGAASVIALFHRDERVDRNIWAERAKLFDQNEIIKLNWFQ